MRGKQLWSLWRRKDGDIRWERVESCAGYHKETAIRVFQTRLINSALGGTPGYEFRLRPVKDNGGV
jgi:hypothetical protein